jgi:hypothetical protein
MTAVGRRSWTIAVENVERCSSVSPDTVWSKTHYDCSTIVMLLRGFAKGVPTKHLTDEMDLAYPSVLKRRHRIQEAVQQGERVGLPGGAPKDGLPDPEVEADEMYQNAGEKIRSAPESG